MYGDRYEFQKRKTSPCNPYALAGRSGDTIGKLVPPEPGFLDKLLDSDLVRYLQQFDAGENRIEAREVEENNVSEVQIRCPNCTHAFGQRVADMQPGMSRRCSACGFRIVFRDDDGRQFRDQEPDRPAGTRRTDAKL